MRATGNNYKTVEMVETPYKKAKAEWDNRMGGAVVQAANWRKIAFIQAGTIIFLIILLVIAYNKSNVTPFIVEVDKIGKVAALEKLDHTVRPNQNSIKYFLGDFIKKVRTIPSDHVILRDNWQSVYKFLTSKATNKMNQYAAKANPAERMKTSTVALEVISVTPMNENTYQVQWKESQFSSEGTFMQEEQYNGIFGIEVQAPDSEEQILTNPLGIYVSDFNWNKIL